MMSKKFTKAMKVFNLDLTDDVNQMLKNWIADAKLLGEKDKVKEYKKLRKALVK